MHRRNIANFGLFQLGWFTCALGAGTQAEDLRVVALALLLAVQFFISRYWRRDVLFVLSAGLLGGLLDSTLGWLGIVGFDGGWQAPPWLIGLWMLFATTLYYSLSWLHGRYGWAALGGAAGGGFSYYAGHRFGALQLGDPVWQSALVIACVWAVTTPLLFWFARRLSRLQCVVSSAPGSAALRQ